VDESPPKRWFGGVRRRLGEVLAWFGSVFVTKVRPNVVGRAKRDVWAGFGIRGGGWPACLVCFLPGLLTRPCGFVLTRPFGACPRSIPSAPGCCSPICGRTCCQLSLLSPLQLVVASAASPGTVFLLVAFVTNLAGVRSVNRLDDDQQSCTEGGMHPGCGRPPPEDKPAKAGARVAAADHRRDRPPVPPGT